MGKIAFVFAGQGAQYPGMGKEISGISGAAKAVFDAADSVRPKTAEQCFSASKEELSLTVNTQPCLFAVDLAIAEALREKGITPEGVAGFSLGEIPALTFAGAFGSVEAGFRLVVRRGEAMNRASNANSGAMAAVMKLTPAAVEELCAQEESVWPVNYNSPVQTVVAGTKESIAEFGAKVKARRGLAVPLAVSGAFHSPFMAPASEELAECLADMEYCRPEIPVYANGNAKPYPADETEGKAQITAQVKSPVRWQETVLRMTADGFDTFIEVGPGKTLSGLIKKTVPGAVVYNVENAADLQATVDAVLAAR